MEYVKIPGSYPDYSIASYVLVLEKGSYWKILYSSHLALAHEVAHAIEYKLYGRTSEYGAWKLAYSFLKPEYWDEKQVNKWYQSYRDRTRFEWVMRKTGEVTRKFYNRAKYPAEIKFNPQPKVSKRTREVLDKILANESWKQEKLL